MIFFTIYNTMIPAHLTCSWVYKTCQSHQPVESWGQTWKNTPLSNGNTIDCSFIHCLRIRLWSLIILIILLHLKWYYVTLIFSQLSYTNTHIIIQYTSSTSPEAMVWLKTLCHFHHVKVSIKTTNFSLFGSCYFWQKHSFFRAAHEYFRAEWQIQWRMKREKE